MNHEISPAIWKRLFALAKAFHELAPWTWMLEMDLFGVAHPQDGEIGYCSIQGMPLEGLAIYNGPYGLDSYKHLFDGDDDIPSPVVLNEKECLALFFVDETELYEEEKQKLALYNKSGSFGGKYPVFRDYSPGWVPWPITEVHQAVWLDVALTQATEVALRFQSDPDLLDHVSNNEAQILVRNVKRGRFKEEWVDEWVTFEESQKDPMLNKELYIRSNCLDLPTKNREWFATLFYDTTPEENEGHRPFLPLVAIVADYFLGESLYQNKFKPGEEEHYIQYTFVQACKRESYRPKTIRLAEDRDIKRWEAIGEILNISIEVEKNSSLAKELQRGYLAGSYEK